MVKKVLIDKANRLYQMPPPILAFAEAERQRMKPRREDIIDLGTFVWPVEFDRSRPPDTDSFRPAQDRQLAEMKEELAAWLSKRFQVRLVSDKEIFIGGSMSSMFYQLTMAYVDVGDVAFVPNVGIPLYRWAVTACDGEPIGYAVSSKGDWIPRFDRLNTGLGRVARLLFLNTPHNPTGAVMSEKELAELIWLAGRENILLVNDASHAGLPAAKPPSMLGIKGSKRVSVEIHSFSHLLGLPPMPLGFAVGNRELINGLKRVARTSPAHLPRYYVDLAIEGLRRDPDVSLEGIRDRLKRTREAAQPLLEMLKLEPAGYTDSPFLWAKIDRRTSSTPLARTLLKRYRILSAPGVSFGENGEGYLRFCLLAGEETFKAAAARVEKRRVIKKRPRK
jgi:LL-diaminopimelate aminotransferase